MFLSKIDNELLLSNLTFSLIPESDSSKETLCQVR